MLSLLFRSVGHSRSPAARRLQPRRQRNRVRCRPVRYHRRPQNQCRLRCPPCRRPWRYRSCPPHPLRLPRLLTHRHPCCHPRLCCPPWPAPSFESRRRPDDIAAARRRALPAAFRIIDTPYTKKRKGAPIQRSTPLEVPPTHPPRPGTRRVASPGHPAWTAPNPQFSRVLEHPRALIRSGAQEGIATDQAGRLSDR